MDDSCAVCAEILEWVAYGSCGHRDVCSTCVARLRFICGDRRCCICKTESNVVFVTKALGDYTMMINDFSTLPSEVREGKVGSYYYHEDIQGFFDDADHYKMIKAMCRLSCSICDRTDVQPHDASKRRGRFRNIDQLKGHLFHQHKLHMCSLCLEGRKVFICEQKLYTRTQLNRHISTGDSEVDGSESERGGFMGHPKCEFCRTPFYGDNELYTHMSTEHYTCHICQRQHPGQYEYYKNYDDLEIHFRQEHFLCEDEACLAKKFIVFQSEAEMKRHNAMEHGGRMSRSKRNAALQIPTSFRYRRSNDQDSRHGRGRFHRDLSENELSMAIQASLETANPDSTFQDSNGQVALDHGSVDIEPLVQPFESLTTTDPEAFSRYRQALGHDSRNIHLEDASFPPLAGGSTSSQQKPKNDLEGSRNKSMAAHLRRQRNVSVFNSAQAWPAANRAPSNSSTFPRIGTNIVAGASHSSAQTKAANPPSSAYSRAAKAAPSAVHGSQSAGSSRDSHDTGRLGHSVSAPNLADSGSLGPSISDFPPVSAAQVSKLPASNHSSISDFPLVSAAQVRKLPASNPSSISDFPPVSAAQVSKLPASNPSLLNVEDVHTANKSLVGKIRAALEHDQDKYSSFKDISAQYRQGLIDPGKYLDYVRGFGLSHLVLELARLCPDDQKQKELLESYNARLRVNARQENGRGHGSTHLKGCNASRKGKGKSVDAEYSDSKDKLANSILSTVQQLQSSHKPSDEEVEVLSKGGYRTGKGKSKVFVDELQDDTKSGSQPVMNSSGQNCSWTATMSKPKEGDGGGGSNQRKKTSKFHRVRLGDGSVSAFLDLRNSNSDPDPGSEDGRFEDNNSSGGLPVRGAWQSGGGHKLFS